MLGGILPLPLPVGVLQPICSCSVQSLSLDTRLGCDYSSFAFQDLKLFREKAITDCGSIIGVPRDDFYRASSFLGHVGAVPTIVSWVLVIGYWSLGIGLLWSKNKG